MENKKIEFGKMSFIITKRGEYYCVKFVDSNSHREWGGWKIKANIEKNEIASLLKMLDCPLEIVKPVSPTAKRILKNVAVERIAYLESQRKNNMKAWKKFGENLDNYNKN